ncbi:MAG TPA: hypothetical protein VMH83_10990 [Candidatus Acidoferrum sp.]|nr:hypothetical protein [Candidatus Acidoferrum sp.]
MAITLKDYVGEWKSAGWNTHPPADPRIVYYPAADVRVRCVLADSSTYAVPGLPAEPLKIVRFLVLDKDLYPKLAALETADYHLFGEMLVSTPIQVSATEWFTDTIELLPAGTPVPGRQNPAMVPGMRHNLLWNDGLRAKWLCCWNGN